MGYSGKHGTGLALPKVLMVSGSRGDQPHTSQALRSHLSHPNYLMISRGCQPDETTAAPLLRRVLSGLPQVAARPSGNNGSELFDHIHFMDHQQADVRRLERHKISYSVSCDDLLHQSKRSQTHASGDCAKEAASLRGARFVVCPTHWVRDAVVNVMGVSPDRVHVVAQPSPLRSHPHSMNHKPVGVTCIGSSLCSEPLAEFIAAYNRQLYRKPALTVVTTTPPHQPTINSDRLFEHQGRLYEGMDFVSIATEVLAGTQLLVLPEVDRRYRLLLTEAAANGVPAIVPSVGDNSEMVIDGGTGYVVDTKLGSEGMMDSVQRILDNRYRYESMVQQSRRHYVRNLHPQTNIAVIAELLSDAVTDSSKRTRTAVHTFDGVDIGQWADVHPVKNTPKPSIKIDVVGA